MKISCHHTFSCSTSAVSELIFSVSSTRTGVSLTTGGASSIAFLAASLSLTTMAFASSTWSCMSCSVSCSLAISWAFASSRSVCKLTTLEQAHNYQISSSIVIRSEITLNRFSNPKRQVSSSTRFSSLSLASLRAPVSLAACRLSWYTEMMFCAIV